MTNPSTPPTTSSHASPSETPWRSHSPCGHLINTSEGLEGQRGVAYDYITAGNGIFVQSSNDVITARFPIAQATVRGLPPLSPKLELHHGPIPAHILAEAVAAMRSDTTRELYCAVMADPDGQYRLHTPFRPPPHPR